MGAASGPENGLDAVPDFTLAIKGSHSILAGGIFHLGGVLRHLDVDNSANPGLSTDTATGYHITAGLTLGITESTKIGLQGNFGDGNGRYIQFGGTAAATGNAGQLDTLRQAGVLGWIQHKWSDNLQSNLVGGHYMNLEGSISSEGTALGASVRTEQYAAVNLIYSPRGNINLGIEGSYIRNSFTNGLANADHFRIQTSLQFAF